eukprot:4510234-Pleurochrysis_carterae.AAC.1
MRKFGFMVSPGHLWSRAVGCSQVFAAMDAPSNNWYRLTSSPLRHTIRRKAARQARPPRAAAWSA